MAHPWNSNYVLPGYVRAESITPGRARVTPYRRRGTTDVRQSPVVVTPYVKRRTTDFSWPSGLGDFVPKVKVPKPKLTAPVKPVFVPKVTTVKTILTRAKLVFSPGPVLKIPSRPIPTRAKLPSRPTMRLPDRPKVPEGAWSGALPPTGGGGGWTADGGGGGGDGGGGAWSPDELLDSAEGESEVLDEEQAAETGEGRGAPAGRGAPEGRGAPAPKKSSLVPLTLAALALKFLL